MAIVPPENDCKATLLRLIEFERGSARQRATLDENRSATSRNFHNVRDRRETAKKLAKSHLDNAKTLLENKRGKGSARDTA
jgi:hypothetical protein